MMESTWTHVLYTALPQPVTPDSLIAFLHNHDAIIGLSPLVTRWEKEAPSSPGDNDDNDQTTYNVQEQIPLLPLNLWNHTISFTAAFSDRPTGLWTRVHAPLNFISEAVYEVKRVDDEKESRDGNVVDARGRVIGSGHDGQQWVLKETITSSCNFVFKAFVDASLVPTRRTIANGMMKKLLEQQQHSST